MKRMFSAFVVAMFVAGLAGLAAAQTPVTPEKKAGDKMEKSDKAGDKMDKKMASKSANGTVKSAAADSIVVAGKEKGKDAEWTFAVDSKTTIKKGGKAITAADLKAGDSVLVRYMEHDGKAMAQTVTVKGGGMAKKAENPCAAKKTDAPKGEPKK